MHVEHPAPILRGAKGIGHAIGRSEKWVRRRYARGVDAWIFKSGSSPNSPLAVHRTNLPALRELAAVHEGPPAAG